MMAKYPRLRRWLRLLAVVLFALVVGWLLASLFVAYRLTHRPYEPFAEPAPVIEKAACEDVRLQTDDGEEIGAWYRPGPDDGPSVLMLHGHMASRKQCGKLAPPYVEAGCSLLLISMRAHGDSTGERDDIGYSARHDVVAAVEYLEQRRPGKPIVIQGVSMGSAAAIFAAPELGTRVRGYILESPYRDLKTAVRNRIEKHLPTPLDSMAYGGLLCVSPLVIDDLDAVAPVNYIGRIPESVPVLILSGAADDFARPVEAQALFDEVRTHARLVWFDGAGHVMLYKHDPALYQTVTHELLASVSDGASPKSRR